MGKALASFFTKCNVLFSIIMCAYEVKMITIIYYKKKKYYDNQSTHFKIMICCTYIKTSIRYDELLYYGIGRGLTIVVLSYCVCVSY